MPTLHMERTSARLGGMPIRELILDLYQRHAKAGEPAVAKVVASSLGVSSYTLWSWRNKLGITRAEVNQATLLGEQARKEQTPAVNG